MGMKEACTQHKGWSRYVETHVVAVFIAVLSVPAAAGCRGFFFFLCKVVHCLLRQQSPRMGKRLCKSTAERA